MQAISVPKARASVIQLDFAARLEAQESSQTRPGPSWRCRKLSPSMLC